MKIIKKLQGWIDLLLEAKNNPKLQNNIKTDQDIRFLHKLKKKIDKLK
jgi:hypothetical protein